MLYELLAGEPPIDLGGDLSGAVCRIVAGEIEPPSQKVKGYARERLRQVAARRGLGPDELAGRLEGELDQLLMRATARTADDRYASAVAFGAALDSWIGD